ncbi:hypothetical protein MSC49_36220 [Methylosinus sp. C49]|uniref:hypothetical protein n=1 Tax=Methylosinus sp. C49 TaxID=2699395 RepID=UPI001366846A|nr:hypothetical protein [Methylosinus sp. C49]BBU63687.1 hypothetical protein MSC49_36220 [Methylosinus sp. C49]
MNIAFPAIVSKLEVEGSYVLGRTAALGSKPAILLVVNQLIGNSTASLIAVVLVVVSLAMAASGFNSHRVFYKLYFGERKHRGLKISYRSYVNAVACQIVLAAIPISLYMRWQNGQFLLAFIVVAYFASERLADESQRFLIFFGARAEWGRKILIKALIQVLGVAVVCAVASNEQAATGAVAALALGNIIPYAGHLRWPYFPSQWSMLLDGWRASREQTNFWILSAVTAPIAYMDRIVVMIYNQSDMALFVLLVSCLSIIQNAVEYFFYSLRRRDILQSKFKIQDLVFSRNMYAIVGGSAFVGIVLCFVVLDQYSERSIDKYGLIPFILICQLSLALSLVIREIIFWNHDILQLTLLEAAFVIAVLAILMGLRVVGADYIAALGVLSALYVGRFALLSALTVRATRW